MEALAQTIVCLREEAGMSPRDLAEAGDIPISTLTDVEEGKAEPRWGTLRRIARGLEMELENLLGQAEHLEGEMRRDEGAGGPGGRRGR